MLSPRSAIWITAPSDRTRLAWLLPELSRLSLSWVSLSWVIFVLGRVPRFSRQQEGKDPATEVGGPHGPAVRPDHSVNLLVRGQFEDLPSTPAPEDAAAGDPASSARFMGTLLTTHVPDDRFPRAPRRWLSPFGVRLVGGERRLHGLGRCSILLKRQVSSVLIPLTVVSGSMRPMPARLNPTFPGEIRFFRAFQHPPFAPC